MSTTAFVLAAAALGAGVAAHTAAKFFVFHPLVPSSIEPNGDVVLENWTRFPLLVERVRYHMYDPPNASLEEAIEPQWVEPGQKVITHRENALHRVMDCRHIVDMGITVRVAYTPFRFTLWRMSLYPHSYFAPEPCCGE